MENKFSMKFIGLSENEALARTVAAAFASTLDPTIEELAELKTAVSEAVTNAIVHAYPNECGSVGLDGRISGDTVYITVTDSGVGIADIERAREPLYTGKPEQERSGLGFSIMESFCDNIEVESEEGKGTAVTLIKRMGGEQKEV